MLLIGLIKYTKGTCVGLNAYCQNPTINSTQCNSVEVRHSSQLNYNTNITDVCPNLRQGKVKAKLRIGHRKFKSKGACKYYISMLGGMGGLKEMLILLMWLGGGL